ncbi:MAG: SGNH/GDSL hydrolase family protein, partial [Ruthenibacterium sp.]
MMSNLKITQADANMAAAPQQSKAEELQWYSPELPYFRLAGFAFGGSENGYCRFPTSAAAAMQPANPALAMLASNTAGGQLYFCTDSSVLQIKVTLRDTAVLCHMTATGQCGFDCYSMDEQGKYQFVNAVKYDQNVTEYTFEFLSGYETKFRNFLLHFPLYCGVKQLQIGLRKDAKLALPKSFKQDGRVVVYGTSITQGACASRPGMAYTNLLSRQLGIEWINFGFSGNGNGETAVIQLAASIPNVRLFVVDYEANAGLNGVLEKTFDGVIDGFRAVHPHTPILVLSLIKVASLMHSASQQADLLRRRIFMQKNIANRVQNGDENLC